MLCRHQETEARLAGPAGKKARIGTASGWNVAHALNSLPVIEAVAARTATLESKRRLFRNIVSFIDGSKDTSRVV